MKNYTINELKPGMIAGKSIYTSQGQLILQESTVLTEKLISRLRFYNIGEALIRDTEKPAGSSSVRSFQSRTQRLQQDPEFQKFQVTYSRKMAALQDSLSGLLNPAQQNLDTDSLLQSLEDLSLNTQSKEDLFDMLRNMRQINDSIYSHSLNVAMIARMMGKWLHLSEADLEILTLCGLLHDIGKTALPIELLNKPGKYTPEEFAMAKQHPMLGYQMIMNQPVDSRIKNAILMHHERCDGSGYPQGLRFEQMDDFAMLIAIADVYDAMTASRSYRKPLCPFHVIDAFEREGLQKYHPRYILTFLEHIADTYLHNRVLLNNGQSATIVMLNKQHLTRPYIQLGDNSIIDMTTRKDLEIVSIL